MLSRTTGQTFRLVNPTESCQGQVVLTAVVWGSPGLLVTVQVWTTALVARFRIRTDPFQFRTALPDKTIRRGVSRHWPVVPLTGYRLWTDNAAVFWPRPIQTRTRAGIRRIRKKWLSCMTGKMGETVRSEARIRRLPLSDLLRR